MSPQATAASKDKGSTDGTSSSAGRFVVSLPKEVGAKIDALGQKMRAEVEKTLGVAPDLSRAQVVQSLVDSSLRRLEQQANGGDAGSTDA